MSVEEQRAFQFVIRSLAPVLMSVVGVVQIRKVRLSSLAACDQLPLTFLEKLRAFDSLLLILLPIPVTILEALHDMLIWENAVQHSFEMIAWTCVFYLQTLEIHRYVTTPLITRIFCFVEALFLIEQIYHLIAEETSTLGLCIVILFQYACTVLMAIFAFLHFRTVDGDSMWWAVANSYQADYYTHETTITAQTRTAASDSGDVSLEIEQVKGQLARPLLSPSSQSNLTPLGQFPPAPSSPSLGAPSTQAPMPTTKGPLSVFVRDFEITGKNDGFSVSDIWGLSPYCIFTIRVKWDKKSIWEVRRRFSDFRLLRNSLRKGKTPERVSSKKGKSPSSTSATSAKSKAAEKKSFEGGFPNKTDEFETISEVFPSKLKEGKEGKAGGCCTSKISKTAMITNMIQSLNQFLQELLASPETKYHELFRSFCSEGRVSSNEKFSDQLCIYDFQLLSVVGKGSYGKVMQARKKDSGKIYAIKVLLKKDLKKQTQITHTQTERHILGAVTHPFICSLRYAFQNRTKLYMVMDFFNGGELFFHLNKGPFDEARTRYYIAEITLAIEHLHSLFVVYRDLKPENVLLDSDGHIKLSDFGLSKKFKAGGSYETRTFCGTPQYVAPEIISNKGYSFGVDWWAMGCLTYELLTRKPPFEAKNSNALYSAISHSPVNYPSVISPLAKSFIAGLLEKLPAQRLGFRGASEIKEHPFFAGLDWNALYQKRLPVPFKPPQDPEDTSCVWKDFLDDEVKDTPTEAPLLDSLVRDLPGFTFAPQTLNTFAGSMAVRNNLLGDGRPD